MADDDDDGDDDDGDATWWVFVANLQKLNLNSWRHCS